jgi:nicotinamide phosphoribosyltransferase
MLKINPTLLIDFYKAVHAEMLPKGITKSVSYATLRMTRIPEWDEAVFTGIQSTCKIFFIDAFNELFFGQPKKKAVSEYARIMDNGMGEKTYGIKKISDLYDLGYLPIEVRVLPEGTLVPTQVPVIEISNTHPDFAWLPQALESLTSTELWHSIISATVAYQYRKVVNEFYDKTCDDNVPRARALGNFDFRGDHSYWSAIKTGAAWATSFLNTATVPAIPFLEKVYNCNCETEPVLYGSPSSEHSVMCSNRAVDGDEETFLRRLLTEIYPNTSFSCVLDSYDYENIIDNVLPKLKKEIMEHNGCMLMRGDSGDCVKVVTDTVFKLWEHFGGTTNSKGYKVLDPHVKAIYGDSITIQRCRQIYEILEANGFACSNVALGVGSFSFMCVEREKMVAVKLDDGRCVTGTTTVLEPFTRDTFGIALKATYCEINGDPYPIFKNPKESTFKKSQRGCCVVYRDDKDKLCCEDGHTWEEAVSDKRNLFETIFKDSKMIKEFSLKDIRNRLWGENF